MFGRDRLQTYRRYIADKWPTFVQHIANIDVYIILPWRTRGGHMADMCPSNILEKMLVNDIQLLVTEE